MSQEATDQLNQVSHVTGAGTVGMGRLFPGGPAMGTVWMGDQEVKVEESARQLANDVDG
jgi:hypothetical protein